MQIELSEQEIERLLISLLRQLEYLNKCLEKDTSDCRKIFEVAQEDSSQLYDKLYNYLKESKE